MSITLTGVAATFSPGALTAIGAGTATFNMNFTEIAEEAWERAGREMRTGQDLRTARRSMNLMTIEWQNRGINMWTIDEGSIPLLAGVDEYDLPADTIDILDHVTRSNAGEVGQTDLTVTRISSSTYATLSAKRVTGRPLQVWVRRLRDAPKIVVWPIPQNDNDTFVYWRMRRIEDAGRGMTTADVNFRFLPALAAGLAFHIAMKVPELVGRVELLKGVYEEQFRLAAEEDREKASVRFVPGRG